jgi:phosphate starvation-inducible protein PhoH
MSKRRKTSKQNELFDLTEALVRNGKAIDQGPKRKTWTIHDLRQIKPLTATQEEMFHDFIMGKNICAYGSAGTGKTFIALWLALNELLRKESGVHRIIIIRSAVPTRDQGFLPGTLEEKSAVYEAPYRDMIHDFFGRYSTYDDMKATGVIEFCTTSYLRGLTWDNAIVIVDEGQNMRFDEINTIMTRVGKYTRLIFVGDLTQTDLHRANDCSGMIDLLKILPSLPSFNTIRFTHHDIVRSEFVKQWIVATEEQRK